MLSTEDRPGIAERYACAIESSNLRTSLDRGCDTDVLMAAGWAKPDERETLKMGASLYRLRSEFDSAKAEVRGQGATPMVDLVLALMKMPSLPSVKAELGRWAVRQATIRAFMEPDKVVLALVGQAMQMFLDPTCQKCNGVGKTGEYGGAMPLCKHCVDGKRTFKLAGRTDQQRAFVQFVLSSMEKSASGAEDSMKRLLRSPQ